MKWTAVVIVILSYGVLAHPVTDKDSGKAKVFPKECSIGPSYWCQNISSARDCGATKHCIQTVWEHTKLEADNDDICTICKDMVTQARDQLESNETQEEIKEVFEGSCKLIPVKIIAEECIKMSDEFIPELVDALASQMNPQMVCATAGLCNSVRVDQLLAEMNVPVIKSADPYAKYGRDCSNCVTLVDGAQKNLANTRDGKILSKMITACGYLSSLSTGCHEIVLSNFNSIVKHLRDHFNSDEVCDFAGVCKAKHHEHAQLAVEVIPRSEIGVSHHKKDETCELCEQLVQHLRDVLVSNTTEEEFKDVLKGLCRQTRSFQSQCLNIVDEYYPLIYKYLSDDLNPRFICDLAGICHEELTSPKADDLAWLELPDGTINSELITLSQLGFLFDGQLAGLDEARSYQEFPKRPTDVHIIDALPANRYMPQTLIGSNKELCELCQLFLHYVQVQLTSPATEAEIKEVVDDACDHLPKGVREQCRNFVVIYGDAFVALLAQEIDPSQICPQLSLCPSKEQIQALKKAEKYGDPGCPICMYSIHKLEDLLEDNKTEESIRAALDKVCKLVPKNQEAGCIKLVELYSEELIDMLIADFTPEQICMYLKLCKPHAFHSAAPQDEKDAEIITNEIPQLPEIKSMPLEIVQGDELVQEATSSREVKRDDPKCVICEFIMTQLDDMLKNNATDEEIKDAVHTVCNYLPKSVAKQCNDFVFEYADLVIQLLIQELEPKAVCQELGLCQSGTAQAPKAAMHISSEAKCKLCVVVVEAMDKLLEDGEVEKDIDVLLEKVCKLVPSQEVAQCRQVIDEYGPSIALLVAQVANGRDVCMELNLCPAAAHGRRLYGRDKCTWGPSYTCQSEFHAMACNATKYCQKMAWKAKNLPKKTA